MDRYGRYGSFDAQPGKGQLLASMLLEASDLLGENEDCLLYVVGRSTESPDTVSVYEAWTSKEANADSLTDDRISELIGRARPLLAGMSETVEFVPVGGKGSPGPGPSTK